MNKKLKSKKINTNKGITLIALIITIIVLLILAVVAIRAVQGDGILAHAKNARDEYQEAQGNEATTLQDYEDYITEQNGGTVYKKITVGTIAQKNGTINGEAPSANNPIIPAGFAPIDTDTSSWEDVEEGVKNGLVISDATTEGAGNEFVWIPVSTLSEFAITKGFLSDKNGRRNYRGVLYDWERDSTGNTKLGSSTDYRDFREPDNLDSSYDSASNLSEWTKTLYQERFNAMVESIAKYKGFYVGRYEMSEANGKAQSKKGELSLTNENWFGLYNKAKTYVPSTTEVSSVTSEMIWGCQYDAMMRWMQENEIDVTLENPIDTGRKNSEGGGKTLNNTEKNTGNEKNDRLNNVYDLLGNSLEWTQEAVYTECRVCRGGCFDESFDAAVRGDGVEPAARVAVATLVHACHFM